MERRNFLFAPLLAVLLPPGLNPFRDQYERAQAEQDMACIPASAYQPHCGDTDGELFSHSCSSSFKPGKQCEAASGYVQKCMPATAIGKGSGS